MTTIVKDLWRDIIGYVPLADLRDLSRASPLFDEVICVLGIKVIYDNDSGRNGVINLNDVGYRQINDINDIIVIRFDTGPLKIFVRVRSYKVGRFLSGGVTNNTEEVPMKEEYKNLTDYDLMVNNIPNSMTATINVLVDRNLARFHLWDSTNNILLSPGLDSFDIVYCGNKTDMSYNYNKMSTKKYMSGLIEYIDFNSKCTVTKVMGFSRTYIIGHFKILFRDGKWIV